MKCLNVLKNHGRNLARQLFFRDLLHRPVAQQASGKEQSRIRTDVRLLEQLLELFGKSRARYDDIDGKRRLFPG